MPANLPPEYFDAEARFKEASTPQEKIAALEALISSIPKHKGTDKLRADYRRRLSRLRDEAAKKKKGGKGDLYSVERQGAAQVVLMGFANSGKSAVLAAVTKAHPVVADFPMTTVMPLAGMMPFEDIQFQLVDLPPIGNESTDGWVSGIVRTAGMIMLVVDLSEDADIQADLLLEQLDSWKIEIAREDSKAEGEEGRKLKPLIVVANKCDSEGAEEKMTLLRDRYEVSFPIIPVSAATSEGLEDLRRAVFEHSGVVRVYSKEPGKDADLQTPFTVPSGTKVLDLARIIHKDFVRNLRYACIWGSARFDGQRVQKDYVLHDRDIVEFHIR